MLNSCFCSLENLINASILLFVRVHGKEHTYSFADTIEVKKGLRNSTERVR